MIKNTKIEKTIIAVCANCPILGNHIHFEGKTIPVENNKNNIEVLTLKSEEVFFPRPSK